MHILNCQCLIWMQKGYTEVETKDGRILNISDTYKKDVRARYSKLLWDGDV